MKKQLKYFSRILVLFGMGIVVAAPTFAQEYKEAFNTARDAAQAKNYTAAYDGFVVAARLAAEAGDQDVANSANKILSQLDFRNGKDLSDAENFEGALQHFDAGIEHFSTYIKNYQGRAIALKKLDRDDESIEAYVDIIELGERIADHAAVGAAQESIRSHFHYKASSALGRRENPTRADAEEAVGYILQLQEYLEADSDTYFYLAAANSALGKYDEAIAYADEALDLHRGSRTDKAKIFFIKGEALMYQGNTSEAKEAFQNATFGSYKASAEHYLETL